MVSKAYHRGPAWWAKSAVGATFVCVCGLLGGLCKDQSATRVYRAVLGSVFRVLEADVAFIYFGGVLLLGAALRMFWGCSAAALVLHLRCFCGFSLPFEFLQSQAGGCVCCSLPRLTPCPFLGKAGGASKRREQLTHFGTLGAISHQHN